jgi:hypothetical protein
LLRRGVAIFDELKQGVRDNLSDPTAGELRIGSAAGLAEGIVLAVIERLSRQYPRLVFHIVPGGLLAQFLETFCQQPSIFWRLILWLPWKQPVTQRSDNSLIKRILAGNHEACVELIRQYHAPIYRLLVHLSRDAHLDGRLRAQRA